MKAVTLMKNNEIIVIYQEVGKSPNLQRIKNDIYSFEKLLERRSTNNSL